MKLLLLFAFAWHLYSFVDKPFEGVWKGTITRDFGGEITTDSIQFVLQQNGDTISGYCILFSKNGKYIKSAVEGFYMDDIKMLKLTETAMQATNILLSANDFFLDRYLLSVDSDGTPDLYGKSIPCEKKVIYGRSKMHIRKI